MPRVSGWSPITPRTAAPDVQAARFELSGSMSTGMPEASDVTALPGGRFLIVGDQKDSATLIDINGKKAQLALPGLKKGASQLEGVAYDPVNKRLFVSREEARELVSYDWNALEKHGKAKHETTIDLAIGGPANKGIEGLAYLPAGVSPTGQPQLVLAREGQPRELSLMSDSGKGKLLQVKLEKEVKDVCHDFSAVAVDPKTGNLFISSDESAAVVQVKLVRDGDKVRGQFVQSFPLRNEKGKPLARVEGLAFNEKGDLFVLTENDGKLHQLTRQ